VTWWSVENSIKGEHGRVPCGARPGRNFNTVGTGPKGLGSCHCSYTSVRIENMFIRARCYEYNHSREAMDKGRSLVQAKVILGAHLPTSTPIEPTDICVNLFPF
jgi:hypothetical protein